MVQCDGKCLCRNHYPREFTSFTKHSEDGYPTYTRRDTGESVRIRGVALDNHYVISYNSYLASFNCHINLKICSTIKAVKYLYDYVYKGKVIRTLGTKESVAKSFTEHYVWHSQSKTWNKRKRSKVIRRLAFVTPSEGEHYYLRFLLAHVGGPCSFKDLIILNNQVCAIIHDATLKQGFVEPDDLIEQCLDEAIEVQMPHDLRKLFLRTSH